MGPPYQRASRDDVLGGDGACEDAAGRDGVGGSLGGEGLTSTMPVRASSACDVVTAQTATSAALNARARMHTNNAMCVPHPRFARMQRTTRKGVAASRSHTTD